MRVEFPFIKEKANVVDYILRPFAKIVLNRDIPDGSMLIQALI